VETDNPVMTSQNEVNGIVCGSKDSIVTFAVGHSHSGSISDQIDNLVKDIHISAFKESQKYDKRTIIY
jgi:hypothetical protein